MNAPTILGPDDTPTAALCHADMMGRAALEQLAVAAGLEVVVEAEHAPALLQAVQFQPVNVVLLENDLPGTQGREIIGDLRQGNPPCEVVLVTGDLSLREEVHSRGAWAIAPRGDAEAMGRILEEIIAYLRTGERRGGGDRRSNPDRRVEQDWSKVTSERRIGDDRRQTERRDD